MSTPALSDRELRIAKYVSQGYSNRDIASELQLSEQVVKNVIHSLFDRLGVWNRVELANYFSQAGSAEQRAAQERIEAARVDELRKRHILDSSSERIFDELASLAARIFAVPIALVDLVDSGRVWIKAASGLALSEVNREITICHHTIQQSQVFVINDTAADSRFACNPLITGEAKVRFYAAAPILTEDGYALGVVCIVDHVPRELTDSECRVLQSLARLALEQIELRSKLLHKEENHHAESENDKSLTSTA